MLSLVLFYLAANWSYLEYVDVLFPPNYDEKSEFKDKTDHEIPKCRHCEVSKILQIPLLSEATYLLGNSLFKVYGKVYEVPNDGETHSGHRDVALNPLVLQSVLYLDQRIVY